MAYIRKHGKVFLWAFLALSVLLVTCVSFLGFENRAFLHWAFIITLVLLIVCVCSLGFLIFNLVRGTRPTGDPNFDQYFGLVIPVYVILLILPAFTVTVLLAVLLVLLTLIGHL
jgi:hypothetical protein